MLVDTKNIVVIGGERDLALANALIGSNDTAVFRETSMATTMHETKEETKNEYLLQDSSPSKGSMDCVWMDSPATMEDHEIEAILSKISHPEAYKVFWANTNGSSKRIRDVIFAFQKKNQTKHVVLQLEDQEYNGTPGLLSSWIPSTNPKKHENLADVWTDVHMPLMWRAAIYTGASPIMTHLLEKQLELLRSMLLTKEDSSYVEVGCGTAEMQSQLHKYCKFAVGVELSPMMLELAETLHPELKTAGNHLVCANAVELEDSLRNTPDIPQEEFWGTEKIVCILMNTLGILPDEIRQRVIHQMIRVAGDNGTVVIGCWHCDSFSVGMDEFYTQHPELCGKIDDSAVIDYEKSNMLVPSTGYSSHWFSADEIISFVPEGDYEIEVKVMGVGIFVLIRQKRQ